MSELNVSPISDTLFRKNLYTKSWALQQNLFKSLEPDITGNEFEDDYRNIFENFKLDSSINYSHLKEDCKFFNYGDDVEFSFYDNLLNKFKEENKKVSKNNKFGESKCEFNKKEKKGMKRKKSKEKRKISETIHIVNLNEEKSPMKEIILKKEEKNLKGGKDSKVHFDLPSTEIHKSIYEDRKNSMISPNILKLQNEFEKQNHTFIQANLVKRKQSTTQNIPSVERYSNMFPKENLDATAKYTPSRFKKDNIKFNSNSRKISESDKKEKKTPKLSGANKIIKQETKKDNNINISSTPPNNFSEKTENSKYQFSPELDYNVHNNDNNLIVLVAGEQEKKKKKSIFNCCIPFFK